LQAQPLYRDCQLVFGRTATLNGFEAVEFEVAFSIDLNLNRNRRSPGRPDSLQIAGDTGTSGEATGGTLFGRPATAGLGSIPSIGGSR
jgi:hypothetical protein